MRYGSIYLLRNTVNGKVYVGQTTTSINARLASHAYEARRGKHNLPLYRAIRKYGIDAFSREELEVCFSKEDLDAAERRHIAEYGALDSAKGYNLREGGSKGKLSPESIRKGAEARTGPKHFQYGKPLTPEHRAKLSEAGKRRTCSPETRRKLSEAGKRRVWSAEVRRKIGDSKRGHRMPDHVREAMRRGKEAMPHGARAEAVRCIQTGKTYPSSRLAAADIGISTASMCRAIAGKQRLSCGLDFVKVPK